MTAALTTVTTRAVPPPRPRVVVRPAPHREPPFDDELEATSQVGPHDRHLPFAAVAVPQAWRPRPARTSVLPDPGVWGRRLVIGLIETAAGRRPLNQLGALLSPSVGRGISADFERAAGTGKPHWLHRATVRSVRACEPADGVAELCATVQVGPRVRAMAVRLEEHHGRWRCTRLQLG